MGQMRKPLPREVEDGYELFQPMPDGIVAWVRSTRPAPDAADVLEHLRWLRELGKLTEEGEAEVRRQLPELEHVG